ncbi:MAG TPA: hypothetical protein VF929_04195 [Gemmatimonadaceae bacterium]
MNHRHLLPNEVDLLVDGEAGFGVADLRAHLDQCAECRARVDEARSVVDALEALPHFAPDSRLTERVMAQVPLFVPAHVAARDSVARWIPQAGPARMGAVAVFASAASAFTLALVWLAAQGDAAVFVSGLLGDRLRGAMVGAARDVAISLFGEQALRAIQGAGAIGVSLLFGGFLLGAAGTVVGIRRLATVSRR